MLSPPGIRVKTLLYGQNSKYFEATYNPACAIIKFTPIDFINAVLPTELIPYSNIPFVFSVPISISLLT